jgi:hypothetical protein
MTAASFRHDSFAVPTSPTDVDQLAHDREAAAMAIDMYYQSSQYGQAALATMIALLQSRIRKHKASGLGQASSPNAWVDKWMPLEMQD